MTVWGEEGEVGRVPVWGVEGEVGVGVVRPWGREGEGGDLGQLR